MYQKLQTGIVSITLSLSSLSPLVVYGTSSVQSQLEEAQRDLHEYKARLFRASSPKDQAKIQELHEKLSESDLRNQKLLKDLKSLEKNVDSANKHSDTLAVAADALASMIQNLRSSGESQNELFEQQLAFLYDELQMIHVLYEKEKELSASLQADIHTKTTAIQSAIKEAESNRQEWTAALQKHQELQKRLQDSERNYQDALTEAASLRFALDSARTALAQAKNETLQGQRDAAQVQQTLASTQERHQQELDRHSISHLNHHAMAVDYMHYVEAQQQNAELQKNLVGMQLVALMATIKDEKAGQETLANKLDEALKELANAQTAHKAQEELLAARQQEKASQEALANKLDEALQEIANAQTAYKAQEELLAARQEEIAQLQHKADELAAGQASKLHDEKMQQEQIAKELKESLERVGQAQEMHKLQEELLAIREEEIDSLKNRAEQLENQNNQLKVAFEDTINIHHEIKQQFEHLEQDVGSRDGLQDQAIEQLRAQLRESQLMTKELEQQVRALNHFAETQHQAIVNANEMTLQEQTRNRYLQHENMSLKNSLIKSAIADRLPTIRGESQPLPFSLFLGPPPKRPSAFDISEK